VLSAENEELHFNAKTEFCKMVRMNEPTAAYMLWLGDDKPLPSGFFTTKFLTGSFGTGDVFNPKRIAGKTANGAIKLTGKDSKAIAARALKVGRENAFVGADCSSSFKPGGVIFETLCTALTPSAGTKFDETRVKRLIAKLEKLSAHDCAKNANSVAAMFNTLADDTRMPQSCSGDFRKIAISIGTP
jgi:hypothetical protein